MTSLREMAFPIPTPDELQGTPLKGAAKKENEMTDEETIVGYTREMAEAQSADEIMKHWAEDVVWFDITARCLEGYDAVHAEFDEQFGKLDCCGATIREMTCRVSGALGIVTTVQDFWCIAKGATDRTTMTTRQTDCYERRDGRWLLTHQHISLCLADAAALAW